MRISIFFICLALFNCNTFCRNTVLHSTGVEWWQTYGAGWKYPAETREINIQNTSTKIFWVGTKGGLLSVNTTSEKCIRFDLSDLPQAAYNITVIEQTSENLVWALGGNELWKFDGLSWKAQGHNATSMLQLADSSLFICSPDSLKWFHNNLWEGRPFLKTKYYDNVGRSLLTLTKDGKIWVYTEWIGGDVVYAAIMQKFDPKTREFITNLGNDGTNLVGRNIPGSATGLISDSTGKIWLSDWTNLYQVPPVSG